MSDLASWVQWLNLLGCAVQNKRRTYADIKCRKTAVSLENERQNSGSNGQYKPPP